jgi:hypothetical protein
MRRRRVEDGRSFPFWGMEDRAVDDHWISRLGTQAWAIYCVLVRQSDAAGLSFPSASRLSALTGLSPREVRSALKVLLTHGLLVQGSNRNHNVKTVYRVCLPESPPPSPHKTKTPPALAPAPTPDPAREFLASLDEGEEDPAVPMRVVAKDSTRKVRLPTAWAPGDAHRKIAEEEGVDLEREVVLFRDHAEGTGRIMLDWDAAFRTWLRKAREFNGKHYQQGRGSKSAEQAARDEVMSFYENEEVV